MRRFKEDLFQINAAVHGDFFALPRKPRQLRRVRTAREDSYGVREAYVGTPQLQGSTGWAKQLSQLLHSLETRSHKYTR